MNGVAWLGAVVGVAMCTVAAQGQDRAALPPSGSQSAGAAGAAMSSADLETLVAPIALYPDALIIQIVQCAASPFQVRSVTEWLDQNPDLKGTAVQDAAAKQGFDASFVAISLFPQVLHMMNDKPQWTRDIGHAFSTDKDAMFAAVQRLRSQAQAAGNLKSNEQQSVQTVKSDNGDTVIVVQPANPQVVYVPQYDPAVVYTQPAPATTSSDHSDAVVAGLIGFAAGVIVGAAADNDDDHYYYAYGGWGYHGAVVCPGGWNNYYDHREDMANDYYKHRENMANDYYDHREDMAGQRGDNQAQRSDTRSETTSERQQTRSDTTTTNQQQRTDSQAQRADSRSQTTSDRQQTRSDTTTANQAQRGENQSARQSSAESRGSTTSRGASQSAGAAAGTRAGTDSGAFSGYQRGSTERASSTRGKSSMSGRSGGGGGGRSRR
jgi:hypothetical protein